MNEKGDQETDIGRMNGKDWKKVHEKGIIEPLMCSELSYLAFLN